jgi:glycosyltransferase involved in cell wall biosynthesis
LREHYGPISVVVPVYGDGGALGELAARVRRVLEPIAPWELILVNDGSPPPTWNRISELASSDTSDTSGTSSAIKVIKAIKALDLERNFGQHNALLAGIRASTGAIIVTLDDDLQHPPEEIPVLLRQMRDKGDDVVYGTPCEPVHGQRRQFGGSLARRIVATLSGVPEARMVSAFRAFNGRAREALAGQQGRRVFIDGVLCRGSRKVGAVPVRHEPRRHGRSGYGLRRLIGMTHGMTMAFGIARTRIVALLAAGGVAVVAGLIPLRHTSLSGAMIGLGCVFLTAGVACLLLLRQSAASRRGSSYAIRTSINLEFP